VQWRVLWLLNAKFTLGVSGVVLDDEGRVLLLKHTFRRRYPWGLLSGWVRAGEPLEAALHREAAEETGLSISIERLVALRKDRYHLFLEAVFACRAAGGVFRPSNEVSEVQWCRPEELPVGTHPDHQPLIRELAQALKNRSGVPKIGVE
jgi:ADP-ribose pyrophosphatase YjhB (NUDIX family)